MSERFNEFESIERKLVEERKLFEEERKLVEQKLQDEIDRLKKELERISVVEVHANKEAKTSPIVRTCKSTSTCTINGVSKTVVTFKYTHADGTESEVVENS